MQYKGRYRILISAIINY